MEIKHTEVSTHVEPSIIVQAAMADLLFSFMR